MALLTQINIGPNIQRYKVIESITEKEVKQAKFQFSKMKKLGVIAGEFNDEKWIISDESKSVGLNFLFDEVSIFRQKKTSYTEFVDSVKYYICLCFGDYTLLMYPRILNAIKKSVTQTDCFTNSNINIAPLKYPGVSEFLGILSWVEDKYRFSSETNQYDARRRSLAEYQSYFLFDRIINEFWNEASELEKDLFYPLYLWWIISMIIPIRVNEFSVTPKDCITMKNNRWYLTIRRSGLKGRTSSTKRYNLESDYIKYTYEVTNEVASEISNYKHRIKNYGEAEIDSLFSDVMFVKSRKKMGFDSECKIYPHLRVQHFNLILDYYFNLVVGNKYKYKILKKSDTEMIDEHGEIKGILDNEIVKINLGDTRHIALQNLVLNGCDLLMAKEISGHRTIDNIFNYSGNMRRMVRSKAYSLHRWSMERDKSRLFSNDESSADIIPNDIGLGFRELDNGRCCSPLYVRDDITHCIYVDGICDNCSYFENDKDNTIAEKENDFEDKVARMKIWMNSARQFKDKIQVSIAAEQMRTAAVNLQIGYVKDYKKRG